ncbi:hypothetical protein [Planctomyces sp. SH-PL62]|uniref:hypothetical protein n=1 Tax=Planctomyces sp. SH-PL62 TaxID=1636152 RepID=UPI00078DA2DC|nr:hypothetical protein [Planctomyces sp. SH-PL62]AMV36473.1 hypothetical protein VT85_03510 [Planctomyces sp. SH-PL62]
MKRRIMIVSAMAVFLVLGLVAVYLVRREGERLRLAAQLAAQLDATRSVITRAGEDLPQPGPLSRESRVSVSGSQRDWHLEAETKEHTGPVIGLEAEGEASDGGLRPIRIVDKVGNRNAEIIERLADEYRKRGWTYVIEHAE